MEVGKIAFLQRLLGALARCKTDQQLVLQQTIGDFRRCEGSAIKRFAPTIRHYRQARPHLDIDTTSDTQGRLVVLHVLLGRGVRSQQRRNYVLEGFRRCHASSLQDFLV